MNLGGKRIQVFSGNANPHLAAAIAGELGLSVGKAEVGRFRDGEIKLRIGESVRGADVFVVQPTCSPADAHLMELLVMCDTLRRASARTITAVVPYYGYARQDRKEKPREPITAKLVANLITAAGANRVLTMDLHVGQIQGFFDIPVDNLRAEPLLARTIAERVQGPLVVVAPDVGGVARARSFSQRLKAPLAIIDKRRPEPNVSQVMHVIGDVNGKTAVLFDDIIDTGGTLTHAAEALLQNGAKAVHAACTHPVLSGDAPRRIEASLLTELIVTDTIPVPGMAQTPKISVRSVAGLFAEAIKRIYNEASVSEMFE